LNFFVAADAKPTTVEEISRLESKKIKRFHMKKRKPAALSLQEVLELRSKLLNATSSDACFVPAVHALSADRFVSATAPPVTTSMPLIAYELDNPEIVVACEVEVDSSPFPVAMLPHKIFYSVNSPGYEQEQERFIESVRYTTSQLQTISRLTRKTS
jgi:hypothetical protein